MSYTKNINERADRWSAVVVGLCAAALAVFLYLTTSACCAPGDPECDDWAKADVAGDEALALLDAEIVAWAHRPDVVEDLQDVRAAVQLVDEAIDVIAGGGSSTSLDTALDAAVALVEALAKETDDDDMRATLTTVRLALAVAKVAAA